MDRREGRLLAAFWIGLPVTLGLLAVGGLLVSHALQRERLGGQLLRLYPYEVPAHPQLVRFATEQARPLYQHYCAACHGIRMQGNPAIGAPNLADRVCQFYCGVYGLERTILYGSRSTQARSHNITHMPAFGQTGRLTAGEIEDVVQYLLEMNDRPYNAVQSHDGKIIFYDKADCDDCHGPDGGGNPDYGAPDLRGGVWNNGGTPQDLYRSIYYGHHRVMPAWIGVLNLEQIRALAVYLYSISHPVSLTASTATATPAH